jgi:hypothetical protein
MSGRRKKFLVGLYVKNGCGYSSHSMGRAQQRGRHVVRRDALLDVEDTVSGLGEPDAGGECVAAVGDGMATRHAGMAATRTRFAHPGRVVAVSRSGPETEARFPALMRASFSRAAQSLWRLCQVVHSKHAAAADDTQQDGDDGDDQQDVDQSTGGHRGDHAEQPQDNQYYSKGIKHDLLSFELRGWDESGCPTMSGALRAPWIRRALTLQPMHRALLCTAHPCGTEHWFIGTDGPVSHAVPAGRVRNRRKRLGRRHRDRHEQQRCRDVEDVFHIYPISDSDNLFPLLTITCLTTSLRAVARILHVRLCG